MKIKVKKTILVEVSRCNICGEEVEKEPFNRKRIEIVSGLFKTDNFDAHEKCINSVIKDSFKKYIPPKT